MLISLSDHVCTAHVDRKVTCHVIYVHNYHTSIKLNFFSFEKSFIFMCMCILPVCMYICMYVRMYTMCMPSTLELLVLELQPVVTCHIGAGNLAQIV